MQSLLVLYSALAVFGVGVTIVDLIGVFEHGGNPDSGHGSPDHDGGGHDAGAHDDAGGDHDASDGTGHDGDSAHDDDSGHHEDGGQHHDGHALAHEDGHGGSYVASAEAGTRAVARAIGLLRSGVYFSLGAGLTGLFSLLTKVPALSGLLWSAGAGVFIALLARGLRSFIRKDLDSSFKPGEFIMDEATVTVPIGPGAMGKIAVRRYGVETELYARAKDAALSLPRGAKVRIVDWDSDCHWVESLE